MTEAQLIHAGLEYRGIRKPRKGSRKLWKLFFRRLRIAEKSFAAEVHARSEEIFRQPSGLPCSEGLDGLLSDTPERQ